MYGTTAGFFLIYMYTCMQNSKNLLLSPTVPEGDVNKGNVIKHKHSFQVCFVCELYFIYIFKLEI